MWSAWRFLVRSSRSWSVLLDPSLYFNAPPLKLWKLCSCRVKYDFMLEWVVKGNSAQWILLCFPTSRPSVTPSTVNYPDLRVFPHSKVIYSPSITAILPERCNVIGSDTLFQLILFQLNLLLYVCFHFSVVALKIHSDFFRFFVVITQILWVAHCSQYHQACPALSLQFIPAIYLIAPFHFVKSSVYSSLRLPHLSIPSQPAEIVYSSHYCVKWGQNRLSVEAIVNLTGRRGDDYSMYVQGERWPSMC